MNIDYKLIGSRIKAKRTANKKTQEQLAEEISVSVGYISQIERGITKPNLELLAKLSKLLNCDVAYFISDTVVSKNEYLNNEFFEKFRLLNDKEKKIVSDLIDSITNNR